MSEDRGAQRKKNGVLLKIGKKNNTCRDLKTGHSESRGETQHGDQMKQNSHAQ